MRELGLFILKFDSCCDRKILSRAKILFRRVDAKLKIFRLHALYLDVDILWFCETVMARSHHFHSFLRNIKLFHFKHCYWVLVHLEWQLNRSVGFVNAIYLRFLIGQYLFGFEVKLSFDQKFFFLVLNIKIPAFFLSWWPSRKARQSWRAARRKPSGFCYCCVANMSAKRPKFPLR